MRFPLVLSLGACALAVSGGKCPVAWARPTAKLPPGIVATVNGVPIRQADIENRLWRESGAVTLDDVINWEIIRNEARKRGIVVSPEDLQARMLEYKTTFLTAAGNTPADWEALIERRGLHNIETQQLVSMLAARIGEYDAAHAALSSAEEARVNADLARAANKVRARMIFVGKGAEFGGRTANDAKARAEEAAAKIRAGAKWDETALAYSDDVSTRTHGGELGFVTRDQVAKPLEDILFSSDPGPDSLHVVELANGCAVAEVLDRQSTPVTEVERKKAMDDTLKRKQDLAKEITTWFPIAKSSYRVERLLPYNR